MSYHNRRTHPERDSDTGKVPTRKQQDAVQRALAYSVLEFIPKNVSAGQLTSAYRFYCPGCKVYHDILVAPPTKVTWASPDAISPLVSVSTWQENYVDSDKVCVVAIKDSTLEFSENSWHSLKKQIVPMYTMLNRALSPKPLRR